MGVPGSANPMLLAGGAAAYEIDQSLRFNPADSARLYRTLAASQTRTYSFWYKYANLSGGNMYLFHHKNSGDTNYLGVRSGGSPSENQWQTLNQGSSFTEIASSRKYRDPSAWQHVVWKCTSTNVTMYVNGVEFASAGGANTSLSGGTLEIGARGSAEYFGGYIAEFHFVDGTAYNPSDFGETDLTTGAWIPKRFGGTYGANGVYLKFDPAATNGIGHDHSGNGNNFTATGFSTSGTGTDVMSDTPTTNWCTFNPLANAWSNSGTGSVADGNLYLSYSSGNWFGKKGTMAVSSGKWYYEWTNTSGGTSSQCGFTTIESASEINSGVYRYRSDGDKINTSYTSYAATWSTAGDIIGIALDIDAGTIVFYKNGVSQGTAFSSIPAGTYIPECVIEGAGYTGYANFGQRAFAYTPPTGYKALNTANLPEPTIKDGSKHFEALIYPGNGSSTQTITTSFQPDFVWNKCRNVAYTHRLFDRLRGTLDKALYSNATYYEDEYTDYGEVTATSATSVTVGQGSDSANLINASSNTYVLWNWKAGGTGSSNTAGSITSTVSANPSAGFSIVTYTSQVSTKPVTVGHGLGVKPSMIICKNRDAASAWPVYHSALGATKAVFLNSTIASSTSIDYWNDTEPTSTVFTVYDSTGTHAYGTSNKMIAYCFSEVAGYSKFGSYTGGGAPFIYTGFRPAFLLIKSSNESSDWVIMDTARSPYNLADEELNPNSPRIERSDAYIDILSNGFVLKNGAAATNAYQHIYAAFAELPFKYSTAR